MKLKSFGCSFIFGTDLADDGRNGRYATGSFLTWPALIAKDQGHEYLTRARPGAGNFEIMSRVLNEIDLEEPALFIINWTWIDRFGYTKESVGATKPFLNPMGWVSIMPIDEDDITKFYYKELHSQLRDKIETLTCVNTVINALRTKGYQFIMTWTDPLMWERQHHCPNCVAWLQKQISPCLSDFQGTSFVDYSRRMGFKISDTMHPLEDAHRAAADLILSQWDNYIRS